MTAYHDEDENIMAEKTIVPFSAAQRRHEKRLARLIDIKVLAYRAGDVALVRLIELMLEEELGA